MIAAFLGISVPQSLAAVEAVSSGIPAGPAAYREGRWGTLRSILSNTDAQDQERLVLYREPGQVGVQFGSRAWVPAGGKIRVDTPVQWTNAAGADASIEIETLLVQGSQGAESASAPAPALIMRSKPDEQVMGMLVKDVNDALPNTLRAMDTKSANGLRVARLMPSDQAPYANTWAWDILDAVTVASEEVAFGPAQTQAMRQWIARGGRAWLMLDCSSAQWGRALAGDAWTLAEVGQTTLTDVPSAGLGGKGQADERSFLMRRVLWPRAQTLFEWQGYPALLELPIGEGSLLVSTIPLEAWVDEAGTPGPWLSGLKRRLLPEQSIAMVRARQAQDQPDSGSVITSFSSSLVGYAVPNRMTVIALMGLFVVALAGSGLWMMSLGKTERFAVVGVALAVVMAGVLLVIGWTKQSAAPQTLAQMQVVRYAQGQPIAEKTAVLSAYSPAGSDASQIELQGHGSVPDIDSVAKLQGAKRLVWQDQDAWAFELLSLPPGAVHNIGVSSMAMLPSDSSSFVELGADELVGQYDVSAVGELQDAIVLTADSRYGVELEADGRFTVQTTRQLRDGELNLGGTVLGSEAINRVAVMESVARSEGPKQSVRLMGWTTGQPLDVSLSDNAEQREQTLAVLPLQVVAPKQGSPVTIPSALIYYEPSRVGRATAAFDPTTRTWLPDISVSQQSVLQFSLPRSVMPMRVESATLRIDITAPQRRLVIKGRGSREVFSQESATGVVTIELTADDLPPLEPDGTLSLGLDISDTVEFNAIPPTWTIRDLGLSVKGTTGVQP